MTKLISIISVIAISSLSIACGGDEFKVDPNAGSGGEDSSENPEGTGSTGSEGTGSTGSTDGSGGTSSGGTGGYTSICTPLTCEEYSLQKTGTANRACGEIKDGCGGLIFCGNTACETKANYNCGNTVNPNDNWYYAGVSGISDSLEGPGSVPNVVYDNICYGGFSKVNDSLFKEYYCNDWDAYVAIGLNSSPSMTHQQLANEATVEDVSGTGRVCTPPLVEDFNHKWVICC